MPHAARIGQWLHHAHQRPSDKTVGIEQSVRGDGAHEPVQTLVDLKQQKFVERRLMLTKPIERCAWNLRDAAVAQRDEIGLARRVANQRAFSEPTAYRLSA